MKQYVITRIVPAPKGEQLTLSIYVSQDDDDFRLAGYSFVFVNAEAKYNGIPEKENVSLGIGEGLVGKTITAGTNVTKFKVGTDDDDDLFNNCLLTYKVVLRAGGQTLLEETVEDGKDYQIAITTQINITPIT